MGPTSYTFELHVHRVHMYYSIHNLQVCKHCSNKVWYFVHLKKKQRGKQLSIPCKQHIALNPILIGVRARIEGINKKLLLTLLNILSISLDTELCPIAQRQKNKYLYIYRSIENKRLFSNKRKITKCHAKLRKYFQITFVNIAKFIKFTFLIRFFLM